MKKKVNNAGVNKSNIKWCDLSCEYADFPKEDGLDGSNSCRTFIALYCKKLKSPVTKNSPCTVLFGKRRPKSSW